NGRVVMGRGRRGQRFHGVLRIVGADICEMYIFKKQKSILRAVVLRHHEAVRSRRVIGAAASIPRRHPMTAATRKRRRQIPGTVIFDGDLARIGYALNRMCFSFNSAECREAFLRDEEAYMSRYNLTETQKEAVRSRQVLRMIAAGGHPYYLAKLAGIFGLDMQDIGAQQTGVTKEAFQAKLIAAGA